MIILYPTQEKSEINKYNLKELLGDAKWKM